VIATPETIEEGDKARAQAAIDIASGKLLREPDGYYSFPVVLGTMFTGTGKMEILGYTPDGYTAPMSHDVPSPNSQRVTVDNTPGVD
jgi:hypothetical protein